jgi:hydrogenase maturation protease
VEEADRLILFDAIDFGLTPGTLKVYRDDAVPAYLTAKKMSLHQTGFSEVLALADLKGNLPGQIVLIGVQPVQLEDYGGSLTDAVRAQLEPAIALAVQQLRDWGVSLTPRQDDDRLNHASLDMQRYEDERPQPLPAALATTACCKEKTNVPGHSHAGRTLPRTGGRLSARRAMANGRPVAGGRSTAR